MTKNEKRWYAVYTRPRAEKRVDTLLQKKLIESWCPLQKVQRQWSDRKKTILQPLFTSYVSILISIFVRFIMLPPFHVSDAQRACSRNTIYQRHFHIWERERHLNNVSNNPPPISSNIVHPAVDFESLQILISTISVVYYQHMFAQATAPADIPQSLDIFLLQSNSIDW